MVSRFFHPLVSGFSFGLLGGGWRRQLQFRAVRITEIKAAVMGPAQVLRQRLVQMEDRLDLGIQKGRFATEIDPAQSSGDQTDLTVRMKHDGFKHSLETIPLLQQRSDLNALLVVPTAHHDVR